MQIYDNKFKQFEDSVLFLEPKEEDKKRLEFVKIIEKWIAERPDNADLYHKLGLCLYEINEWDDIIKLKIENSFSRAILLDGHSVYSQIFLTFFYFDISKFKLCVMSFKKLFSTSVGTIPRWREANLLVVYASSLIYIDEKMQGDELCSCLEKLYKLYKKLESDEKELIELTYLVDSIETREDTDLIRKLKLVIES